MIAQNAESTLPGALARATTRAVTRTVSARIPTPAGEFQLYHYLNNQDNKEHLAFVLGDILGDSLGNHLGNNQQDVDILVRVHSECFTGDVLGSLRCDCGEQLHKAMQQIAAEGRGVIIYLRQEGRGIGLAEKLKAYNLQDQGYDTVEANLQLGHQADEREYWCAAAILRDLGVRSLRLLTNNPDKIERLQELGVTVTTRTPIEPTITALNSDYLTTKVQRMRHLLTLPPAPIVQHANGSNGATDHSPAADELVESPVSKQLQNLRQRALTHRQPAGQPFVTLSYAQSLDGSIAAQAGAPLRLSSPAAMVVTHALRAQHAAILVGIGTVLADDPQLTVRLGAGREPEQPQPVVVDSHLRLPLTARLFNHPKSLWIATSQAALANAPQRVAALQAQGATVFALPTNAIGRLDLAALLVVLGQRAIASVMVEGGAQIITSFLMTGLANYLVITLAPRFVGGVSAVQGAARAKMRLPSLRALSATPVGEDLLLWGEPHYDYTQ